MPHLIEERQMIAMSNLKILPKEAAAIMGCSPQYIRLGLQQGRLNIGEAIKMSSIWTYNISPALLAARQGMTVQELEAAIKEYRENDN